MEFRAAELSVHAGGDDCRCLDIPPQHPVQATPHHDIGSASKNARRCLLYVDQLAKPNRPVTEPHAVSPIMERLDGKPAFGLLLNLLGRSNILSPAKSFDTSNVTSRPHSTRGNETRA
jgi:hypothetical protein